MLDKNGVEIKTGKVVEISGCYFKSVNGLYFVECSPGDPGQYTLSYSMTQITEDGQILFYKDKYNGRFRPIQISVLDEVKYSYITPAQLEVKSIRNMDEIAAYFQAIADEFEESNCSAAAAEEIRNFYRAIAANCKNAD